MASRLLGFCLLSLILTASPVLAQVRALPQVKRVNLLEF